MTQRTTSALLFSTLLGAAAPVLAQHPVHGPLRPADAQSVLRQQLHSPAANRGTGAGEHYRLVGYKNYNPQTGVLEDTGRYAFSGKRESLFANELENMEGYTAVQPSKLDSGTCITEHGIYEERNQFTYDAADRPTSWFYSGFDQVLRREYEYPQASGPYHFMRSYEPVNGQLTHAFNTVYRFASTNDTLPVWDSSFDVINQLPASKTIYEYAAGKLRKQYFMSWNDQTHQWGAAFDSLINEYDNGGRLSTSTVYTLGTNNAVIPYQQQYFAYNSQNYLVEAVSRQWDGSAWKDEFRTTYDYAPGKPLYTEMITYFSQLDSVGNWYWMPMDKERYTLYPVSARWKDGYKYEWNDNQWNERQLLQFTYNSHGLLDELLFSNWDEQIHGFEVIPSRHRIYTYDYFSTPTAVATASSNGKSLRLYPNPATFNLKILLDEPVEAAVYLTDAGGRTIATGRTNASGQLQLSLEALAAGTYTVHVFSAAGAVIGSSKVTKL